MAANTKRDPVREAMKALRPDAYDDLRRDLDAALAADDPSAIAIAVRRAQTKLAIIATGAEFHPQRHRAISQALREIAPVAPLTNR